MIKGGCGEDMNWFIVASRRGVRECNKECSNKQEWRKNKKNPEMKLKRQLYCVIYNEVLWDFKQEMILNLMLLKKIKRKLIKRFKERFDMIEAG